MNRQMSARLICEMAISLLSISVMKDQSRRLLGTSYRDFPRGVGIVDNDGMIGQVKFSTLESQEEQTMFCPTI